MLRVTPGPALPLHTVAATRALEAALAATLPPHTLMQRAGAATARLALALAPHAQHIWIACGAGHNGGDGLEAAALLRLWGKQPLVSWLGQPERASADIRAALERARAAGVTIGTEPPPQADFVIDALLGIGASRAPEGRLAEWIARMAALGAPVLAVDLPSGLQADSGHAPGPCVRAHHTLSLLTLKPGLFTADGRDHAGQVWWDDLGAAAADAPQAWLAAAPAARPRPHASHKGSYGDVAVVGGARGMGGAALLAATAALHHGAGRVYLGRLDESGPTLDATRPELMWRELRTLDLSALTVVAGCGGGDAIAAALPRCLAAARLVLDADGLNAVAQDPQLQAQLRARAARQRPTVLTPHPLEAARLLGCSAAEVQRERLRAATSLAERYAATVVLKGSGSIVATPGRAPLINPTGNARLATAGSGDVLAGLIGARLAGGDNAHDAAAAAVWLHGQAADRWPAGEPLTAGALACAIAP